MWCRAVTGYSRGIERWLDELHGWFGTIRFPIPQARYIDGELCGYLALDQLQRQSSAEKVIADGLQLLRYSVSAAQPDRPRQHQRCRFIRLAKSIKDRDFALRYAPALDCVGLNLLHQYFHKGRFNSGAFGPASFLRSEARSASAELSSAA